MSTDHQLRRDISLAGAVMLGLGSIIGTGVFVSIGIAAGVAGANVLPAILIAALLAICNGLSSAQLAAAHPVSGGTYEYGYRWLTPTAGFIAGWLFLCAKSASAATAALGLAGYLQLMLGVADEGIFGLGGFLSNVLIALVMLGAMTIVVVVGIKRTTIVNSAIVGVTLVTLAGFVIVGLGPAISGANEHLHGLLSFNSDGHDQLSNSSNQLFSMFSATALMFVAYTGYGRIATLGEEVAEPRRTIPRAMILTLAISMVVYLSVGFVAVSVVGPEALSRVTGRWAAPLLRVASQLETPWVEKLLAVGAIAAMLGVMLNLLLGLSRVVLAMSRRQDLPAHFVRINARGVPLRATLLVALIVGGLVCVGDVRLSWSFSAMTVLIYYAFTNLCAIRIDQSDRIFPVWPAWCGLAGCFSLVAFIQWRVLIVGGIVIGLGLIWRMINQSVVNRKNESR